METQAGGHRGAIKVREPKRYRQPRGLEHYPLQHPVAQRETAARIVVVGERRVTVAQLLEPPGCEPSISVDGQRLSSMILLQWEKLPAKTKASALNNVREWCEDKTTGVQRVEHWGRAWAEYVHAAQKPPGHSAPTLRRQGQLGLAYAESHLQWAKWLAPLAAPCHGCLRVVVVRPMEYFSEGEPPVIDLQKIRMFEGCR